jgi:hypothetical protein
MLCLSMYAGGKLVKVQRPMIALQGKGPLGLTYFTPREVIAVGQALNCEPCIIRGAQLKVPVRNDHSKHGLELADSSTPHLPKGVGVAQLHCRF